MTRLHVKKLPKNYQFESFLFLDSPVAKRGGIEVKISVTRFEEISYLWQKIKLLGTFLSALLGSNWQNFEPTQAIKICFWAKFHRFTEFGQNKTANHLGTLVEMQIVRTLETKIIKLMITNYLQRETFLKQRPTMIYEICFTNNMRRRLTTLCL